MPDQRETPAPQRRQAEGDTGVQVAGESVPAWARKRVTASLLRFRGEYVSPEALNAQARAESDLGRVVGTAHGDAFSLATEAPSQTGAGGSPILETPATPSEDRFAWDASRALVDEQTGELLPCRSLETTQPNTTPKGLTGPHKKVAAALSWNVAHLCQKYGVERVGFLTLTFADHVLDPREASRRYNSLATHVLSKRYAACIRVLERQKSGRIHYHLLVALPDDIRAGVDFDQFAAGKYTSAGNHLRREWAFWRHTSPAYGFGRTELMPVKSNGAALGQYVGKYIGKHIGQREERDKGVRLVSYSGDARMATSKHSNYTTNPDQWRAKVCTFVRQVEGWQRQKNPYARVRNMDDLAFVLGKRWAFHWRDYIFELPPADLSVPF